MFDALGMNEKEQYAVMYKKSISDYLSVLAFRMALESHFDGEEERVAIINSIMKLWIEEQHQGIESQRELFNSQDFLLQRTLFGVKDEDLESSFDKQKQVIEEVAEAFCKKLSGQKLSVVQELKSFGDISKLLS